ncbi:hypothetical protein GGD66_005971 [Bradyrhizobium sp. CIR48]|uniref:hypothetical protein n=1 Tax=Bradyrhizobium sp. CIR48 TaxID=2663840 RepID=UPI001606F0C6|nr:hypothetical protein [Bradyrhizobium sp. CIR48]MBB4427389.1 hypothetical protein [Bradyrhizobium sp. CIR48]
MDEDALIHGQRENVLLLLADLARRTRQPLFQNLSYKIQFARSAHTFSSANHENLESAFLTPCCPGIA